MRSEKCRTPGSVAWAGERTLVRAQEDEAVWEAEEGDEFGCGPVKELVMAKQTHPTGRLIDGRSSEGGLRCRADGAESRVQREGP